MIDESKLSAFLRKCELQYRADHLDCAETLEWLAPYCGTVQEIASFLRSLGFHISQITDEEPWPGERYQWVITTSGVIVYAGRDGLFTKKLRCQSNQEFWPGENSKDYLNVFAHGIKEGQQ